MSIVQSSGCGKSSFLGKWSKNYPSIIVDLGRTRKLCLVLSRQETPSYPSAHHIADVSPEYENFVTWLTSCSEEKVAKSRIEAFVSSILDVITEIQNSTQLPKHSNQITQFCNRLRSIFYGNHKTSNHSHQQHEQPEKQEGYTKSEFFQRVYQLALEVGISRQTTACSVMLMEPRYRNLRVSQAHMTLHRGTKTVAMVRNWETRSSLPSLLPSTMRILF